jgi:hypothetical protein
MRLIEPYASQLREALAEHRRAAEAAEQAPDIEAVREALTRAYHARHFAWQALQDGEEATLRAALAKLGQAA